MTSSEESMHGIFYHLLNTESELASLPPFNIPTAASVIFPATTIYSNLISVLGVFEEFNEDWLLSEVETRRAADPS